MAAQFAGDMSFGPGGDIDAVVKNLGGKVTFQDFWDLDSTADGSIKIDAPREFEIFIAAHTAADRNRFTIAHEIGHYVLHYLLPLSENKEIGKVQARRYGGKDRTEYEANWFAASFLMPEATFRPAYEAAAGDVFEVAAKFRVSISAALVRAKTLGLE
jgi:Zn-dependent peptidase ImmA (M78 family)